MLKTPRLVAAGEKISLVPHQQAENAFSLADVSVAGCGFTFGVVVRFGLCLAKHNEQYLPVLSFSMRRRRRRALVVVSSANRETKIKHKASKNAQATQGKRGSWHNLRVHARHFHVSTDPL